MLPGAFEASAADVLLGHRVRPLADRLTSQWRRGVDVYWREQHRRAAEIAARLAEMEAKADALTPEERGERVWLTAELHGDTVAVPMARALLTEQQEDASLHFLLGRALAEEDDEGALAHLERAVELDPEYTPPACAIAGGLLKRLERDAEADAFWDRAEAYNQMIAEAYAERAVQNLKSTDRFLPHGLDDEALAVLREQVAVPGVKRAYVVRKEMAHLVDKPCFVIAVVPGMRTGLPGNSSQRLVERVLERVRLPGTTIVLTLERSQRSFTRPLRDVPGSEFYRAAGFFASGQPARAAA